MDRLVEHLYPIRTVEGPDNTEDLKQVNDRVSTSRVIGLGEPVHGIHEISTLRHRLFARLVRQHEVRLLGLEVHFSEALSINDYVVHGEGDPIEMLDQLAFWIWKTEAFCDLLNWIRACLTYWKLNENMSAEQTQEIAETLTREGLFPPEDIELVRWDGTPDGWGIALMEADNYGAVNNAFNMWRAAAGDTAFFEKTMTAPAAPVEEIRPQQAALLERLE